MVAISYFFRAMRWRYIIASIKEVKTANLLSPLMIGFMANMLPARAGEFIRAYLLSKKENINYSTSFATIFIERLFDLSYVLLMLLWVLIFRADIFSIENSATNNNLIGYMIKFGWIGFFACSFIFLFSILLQYKNAWAMIIVDYCIKPLPVNWGKKITELIESFTNGLNIIKDKRGLVAINLLTVIITILFLLAFYLLYLAFDINTKLPIISSLIVLCLTVDIFVALFPTPGFFGSYHAACVAALHGIFGISKAVALSYGIIAWFLSMGFTVIVGAIFVVKDNISIGKLSTEKERIK
jgi:uncharacterized protein (TIRG00374 family)